MTDRRSAVHRARLLLAVALDPREVGRRIAEARARMRWTQLEFALQASVSPSTIQRWESGKLPPVRELLRVAELLGVEPDHLVQPPSNGIPAVELLRELGGAVAELAATDKEILQRVRDIQARVARLEEPRRQPAASRKS